MSRQSPLTLKAYQGSEGIDPDEQIVLIGRRRFAAGYYDWLSETRDRSGRSDPSGAPPRLPADMSRIFYGRRDRSLDRLHELRRIYDCVAAHSDQDFVLLIGKGDYAFDQSRLDGRPENLRAIAANNVNVDHPCVHSLPMGRDFRSATLFADFPPQEEKSLLCYANFSLDTHPIRAQVCDRLRSKGFILFQHMGRFLHYGVSRAEYFRNLSSSRFCVCPRGNAIDTFRMWDALYVGTIPIVVREAAFQNELTDLPILFLEHIEQFASLTRAFLEECYERMLHQTYGYDKLRLGYWIDKLEAPLNNHAVRY